MKKINNDLLENWKKEYDQDVSNLILQRALNKNEMQNIALKQESKQVTTFNFSKEIKTLPVANQEKSGRCWIFAGLNVLREIIAKTHNLKEFELSQNYIAFYDKLEKINYFLESVDDF
ncbi:MAG: C1 family peptidase, partial [Candidatus Izemoplasmatales bacterium]|nr:C1 family peptidase [Candidatus Izemoplasmatales bacterium]